MSAQRLLPLALLLAVLALCFVGLGLEPSRIGSPLLGQPLPQRSLPLLSAPGELREIAAMTRGQPAVLNIFASWCVACVHEHPLLMELAAGDQVLLYGISYKDNAQDARSWLRERGNPYSAVLLDDDGSFGRSIGVYGVPESFVLDADGVVVYKHVGPLTRKVWVEDIKPLLSVPI